MTLKTRRFTSGDLEIRELEMTEPGDFVPDHDHFFPHTSIVFSGEFKISVKRKGQLMERVAGPGSHLLIEADDMHRLECIKPGKVWCTFCHRDPETGAPVPEANGWDQAYASRSDGR